MTVAVFGYLILISIEFYGFISPFSSCFFQVSFDLEDISNTSDSVWRHFQTPRSSSKILRCASYQSVAPLGVWKSGQTRPSGFDRLHISICVSKVLLKGNLKSVLTISIGSSIGVK